MLTAMPLKQGIVAVRAEDELVCIIEVRGDRDDDNGERDLRFGCKVWSRLGSLNVGLVRARLARNASSKSSRTVACRCLTQRMRSGRCAQLRACRKCSDVVRETSRGTSGWAVEVVAGCSWSRNRVQVNRTSNGGRYVAVAARYLLLSW
jgi:hypothetical protein